ncbi:putative isopropanol dehydrogenase [Mycena metata]|uniref:Isopropanol dehydrogenase n=1 Tax=Mycena metata TaxID=1033252 RepID=A0AAD7H5A4_9AGAR|nr:putative isopropanol dehydrogenase [Mycena metata]
MATMKALVLHGPNDLRLDQVPKPKASPGSVVVRVKAVPLWDYLPEVINGSKNYPLTFPLIFGTCCVGHVEETGPDVTSLQPGMLVSTTSCTYEMRPRNASCWVSYHGGFTPQEQRLSSGHWRDGCFAEYAAFPAENVHALDEAQLLGRRNGLATIDQLTELASVIPGMGAANAIGVRAGETVLVLPATGFFSSSAVAAVLGLGANVVVAGRSREKLQALVERFGQDGNVVSVVLTGDAHQDAVALRAATPGSRGADAYIDYSPPAAAGTTHIEAGLLALKHYGRCCFAGVIVDKVPLPYALIMSQCLTIRGQFAQSRDDVIQSIRLIETGNLKLTKTILRGFSLEEHEEALKLAGQSGGFEKMVTFTLY